MRVGWRFLQPVLLESDLGVQFALTDTSPAMLPSHMQVSWARMRGRAAAHSHGVQGQLDASQMQQALRGGVGGYAAILKAFGTQAVWSHQRLHIVGYQVELGCPLCGAPSDSLYHRLVECAQTENLRREHLKATDIELMRSSPDCRALALGYQVRISLRTSRLDLTD